MFRIRIIVGKITILMKLIVALKRLSKAVSTMVKGLTGLMGRCVSNLTRGRSAKSSINHTRTIKYMIKTSQVKLPNQIYSRCSSSRNLSVDLQTVLSLKSTESLTLLQIRCKLMNIPSSKNYSSSIKILNCKLQIRCQKDTIISKQFVSHKVV